jgi:ABC-type branched-subunit amino acid transport system substrate-binding protein
MRNRIVWSWALVLLLAACTSKAEDTTTTSVAAPATTTSTAPAVLTGAGVVDETITVAAFLPLSGTLEGFGQSTLEGHEAYWAYVNDVLGGVGGTYAVRVTPLDTAYDEEIARSLWAVNEAQTLAISSVLGSPITSALLAGTGSERILIAAGSQASSWSAAPNVLLNLALPTYRDQVAGAIVAGRAEEPVLTAEPPLGLVYQEGAYFGEDCLAGFEQATERDASGVAVSVGHAASSTEFTEPLAAMEEAGVKTLFVCSTPAAVLQMVATFELGDYRPTLILPAQSYDASLPAAVGVDGDETAGLEALDRVFIIGSLPPFESEAPGMKLLRDNLARFDSRIPDRAIVNPWFFLGYAQAATFHLILEEALDQGDLTREGIWAARDRLGDVDFGFGAGPSRYDDDRIPVVADVVSVPALSTESLFGMVPLGNYYSTR